MSYTSPPVPVTLGANVTLNTPSSAPYAKVVISNLSPFLLEVQGSPIGVQWLEPFTAMLYPTASGHQTFTLVPEQLGNTAPVGAGAGAQVQATWYLDGEEPQGTWPVSLTAQAIASGFATAGLAGVDLLTANGTANASGGIFAPSTPTPFRLWSWGWDPTTIGPAWPTSGGVVFEVVGLSGFTGKDTVSYQEGASDRLGGLWVPAGGTPSWVNYTGVNLDVYMNYSTT